MAAIVAAMVSVQLQRSTLEDTFKEVVHRFRRVLGLVKSVEDIVSSGWTLGLALSNLQDIFSSSELDVCSDAHGAHIDAPTQHSQRLARGVFEA